MRKTPPRWQIEFVCHAWQQQQQASGWHYEYEQGVYNHAML
jgi:hypothetical protein